MTGRAAVLLLAALAPVAAAVETPDGRPAVLRDVAFEQRIGAAVPLDAVVRDDTGTAVRLGDLAAGKPLVLVPAYYGCPTLCGTILNGVLRALRALPFDAGRDFTVVTFSFDPRDGTDAAAERHRDYTAQYGRATGPAGWRFVTADQATITAVTSAIGFRATWDDAHQQFAHAAGLVVVTPAGVVSHYLYGVEFAPRDLRLALVEASAGTLGSPVDQLLLFCFHYDPATGRYSRLAVGAIRVGGALTLAALGTFVVVAVRRERRRTRVAQETA